MSDSEDETILDDIHALESALSGSQKLPCPKEEPSTSKTNNIHMLVYHEEDSESPDNEQLKKLLDLNQELTNALLEVKSKFLSLIEQCKLRQEQVEHKIKTRMKLSSTKHYNWSISMPYFKTKDCYYAPLNSDAKSKIAKNELEFHHLPMSCRWTMRDKNVLLEAIRDEIKSKVQLNSAEEPGKKVFSAEIKRYIGALGEKEFDWMKIGTGGFQNRHTAEECRVMWNVFLHPDINKGKWTKKEDLLLNNLAKTNKCQDWDEIARRLNNRRSGYQCFLRFNNNNLKQNVKSNSWSKHEDDRLKRIVDVLKLGNFIPWSEVSTYIPERTKQQIYYRWMYNVAPYLKKGRFTADEDATFRSALQKYGTNFSRISTFVMPQRTSAQLNDHYNTLNTRETAEKLGRLANSWDYKEDIKLLELYQKLGSNWSGIAKEFNNTKNRIQLRHRYAAIKRYENRGILVENIPRGCPCEDDPEDIAEVVDLNVDIDDVDKELIEFFRTNRLSSSEASSSSEYRKFYSNDELQSHTRNLYNVLQALHVNIVDYPDHERLSEKDRQLFSGLNEFCQVCVNSEEREQIVENFRAMMFGYAVDYEHYVPPLPYSSLPKLNKTRRNQKSTAIDCSREGAGTQVEIDFEFADSPEYVLEEIGGLDGDKDFERLKKLVVKKLNSRNFEPNQKAKANNKIYILSPEVLNKYILQTKQEKVVVINNKARLEQVDELVEPYLNFTWDWFLGVKQVEDDANFLYPVVQTVGRGHHPRREINYELPQFLKPNRALLTCYQTILSHIKSYEKNVHKIQRFKVSYRGRSALELLKRRFEILFTYPMCMAKVSVPSGFESRAQCVLPFWEIEGRSVRKKRTNEEEEEVLVKSEIVEKKFKLVG